jgi:four helix bundle protein
VCRLLGNRWLQLRKNYSEACDAESKADFVHKLHIALKEANETMYWLKVLYGSEFISKNQYDELMNDLDEIYKILFSSVKTAKEKLKLTFPK